MNLFKRPISLRIPLFLLSLPFLFLGCDDDSGGPGDQGESNIRIISVDHITDTYVLKNFGDASEDVSGWRFCSEFNYSAGISTLTIVSGNLNLAPDAEVSISGFPTDEEADFGLYLETGEFDDPEAMVDFVQWGSGGNGRESVAVTKGIWTAGQFVPGISPYVFSGSGTQTGASFWNATGTAPVPVIRFIKVDPTNDTYELRNFGTENVDLTDFRLCSKFFYANSLGALTVESGSLDLAPGETVVLSGFSLDDAEADFGLFLPGTGFSDPDFMIDFMQYGSAGNGREPEANTKGIWTAGDFLPTADFYEYTGNGSQNGLGFWQTGTFSGPNIRFLSVDPANDSYVIKNFGETGLDISAYRLCSKFDYTPNLSSLTIVSGSLDLGPGEEVSLSGWPIDDAAADFGLYIATGGFGSEDSMVDFVQWGSAGNGREGVANTKGIWTTGDFLNGAGPFNYIGDGTENGVSFWQ